MTEAQLLLLVLAVLYVSECVVWLRAEAIAVVVPLFGRPFVRRPASWAGVAFTTLLPARAVFVCEPSPGASFDLDEIDRRVERARRATRRLHGLAVTVFAALFLVAPATGWAFGFTQIALLLVGAFVLANVAIAIAFFRAHRRIDMGDRAHRWTHAIVMLVSTPSAVRAVDHATRHALRGCDPVAVAARLAGANNATVKVLLRELAHPRGAAAPDARYEAARAAGLQHVATTPARDGNAAGYCPRCLCQYEAPAQECMDCTIALVPL